jgi:hypothetical protein
MVKECTENMNTVTILFANGTRQNTTKTSVHLPTAAVAHIPCSVHKIYKSKMMNHKKNVSPHLCSYSTLMLMKVLTHSKCKAVLLHTMEALEGKGRI